MITPDRSGMSTYWSRPQLVEALLDAVAAAGLDLHRTPEALAPLDQFHGGGKMQHVLWPARRG